MKCVDRECRGLNLHNTHNTHFILTRSPLQPNSLEALEPCCLQCQDRRNLQLCSCSARLIFFGFNQPPTFLPTTPYRREHCLPPEDSRSTRCTPFSSSSSSSASFLPPLRDLASRSRALSVACCLPLRLHLTKTLDAIFHPSYSSPSHS